MINTVQINTAQFGSVLKYFYGASIVDQDCYDPVQWERPANWDLVLCGLHLDPKLGLLFHFQCSVPFEQLASISEL